jgi:NADPH:quinone reductase-like Zn-dependent oxidoreductase
MASRLNTRDDSFCPTANFCADAITVRLSEDHRTKSAQLSEIVQRVRDGRLRTNIGNVSTLDDAVAALNPTERRRGKTIIRVRP